MKIRNLLSPKAFFLLLFFAYIPASGQISISNNASANVIVFGNSKISITLDYDHKCAVTNLVVNGETVISDKPGIYSEIRTRTAVLSTRKLASSPELRTESYRVTLHHIDYGENNISIRETWNFYISETDIRFEVERTVSNPFMAEEVSFPSVVFNSIRTWEGAFTGFGGLAWFYLFNEKLCTYGVHTGYSAFWNSITGNGLRLITTCPGREVASKFTRSSDDGLQYSVSLSDGEMNYRYDKDTRRRRFIRQKTDVWDSLLVTAGKYLETMTFSWLNYREEFNRGKLAGINGNQVTNLLNTIARIGVIDAKLFGGNSWHTPYGPVCLHEQYIGQMGLAINDPNYLEGYKQCLDHYRDQAIQPDGRVLSRWAYDNGDAMPGTATPAGFYEAQWGYLFDSNPDFVINVSEIYNQCGDLNWVKGHKESCEKSLGYLLKRDSNGNHLVEMMTDRYTEKKGSDWIDIIWASYENAFVNAELYYALKIWSDIEKQMGDREKAGYYSKYADELRKSFNKPTTEGGFWNEKNNWYVHWVDKDKSVHGNNLVVPVNFMAIAYGICDSELKRKTILDRIENQMQKEKLFAWPICLYSYEKGEGNDWQFPFPNYENGDIFLSWGAMGVEAYAGYKPQLALKYIENILNRYAEDGLAFQRYGRTKQEGLGDDILSGNSLAIVGLYKSIYGINPMADRMFLDPHMPDRLYGTELNYNFRGDKLTISLNRGRNSISNDHFRLISTGRFGFNAGDHEMEYFNDRSDVCSLKMKTTGNGKLSVEIISWSENEFSWKQTSTDIKDPVSCRVYSAKPGSSYSVSVNGKIRKTLKGDQQGCLVFDIEKDTQVSEIHVKIL
jgi:hypothetical protein